MSNFNQNGLRGSVPVLNVPLPTELPVTAAQFCTTERDN